MPVRLPVRVLVPARCLLCRLPCEVAIPPDGDRAASLRRLPCPKCRERGRLIER